MPGPLRKKRGYVTGFGIDGPPVHGLRSIDTPTYNESDTQTGPGNPKNGQGSPEETQERQEKGWKQEEEGGKTKEKGGRRKEEGGVRPPEDSCAYDSASP